MFYLPSDFFLVSPTAAALGQVELPLSHTALTPPARPVLEPRAWESLGPDRRREGRKEDSLVSLLTSAKRKKHHSITKVFFGHPVASCMVLRMWLTSEVPSP